MTDTKHVVKHWHTQYGEYVTVDGYYGHFVVAHERITDEEAVKKYDEITANMTEEDRITGRGN